MEYLFENGTILTMEERMPAAQALLVRDGRIAAVGAREAVAAQASGDAERVDLAGRAVMPAFLDSHSHFFAVANGFLQVSLEGCASWADIAERIQSYIDQIKNPYLFKVGNTVVHVSYADTERTMNDNFVSMIASM